MSAELAAQIEQGLNALHQKHDKISSEYKSMHDEIKKDIVTFTKSTQEAQLEAKAHLGRIELLEQKLAESGASQLSKASPKDILSVIDSAIFKTASETDGGVSFSDLLKKSQTASQGSAGGITLNPSLVSDVIVTYITDSAPMLQEASVVRLNQGERSFTKWFKTIETGAKAAGELQSNGDTNATYASVEIPTIRYSSSNVISTELTRGSSIVTTTSITEDIFQDLNYIMQNHAVLGTGSESMQGILSEKYWIDNAYESSGQTASPNVPTVADLLNMKTKFKFSRYRNGGKYYMSYDTYAALMTEKGTDGHFILKDGEFWFQNSPIVFLDDMPKTLQTDKVSVLYGDMKKAYTIVIDASFDTIINRTFNTRKGLTEVTVATFAGGGVMDKEALVGLKGA